MAKAVICPVCGGRGRVLPPVLYNDENEGKICHGCSGRGWVEVSEYEWLDTNGYLEYLRAEYLGEAVHHFCWGEY